MTSYSNYVNGVIRNKVTIPPSGTIKKTNSIKEYITDYTTFSIDPLWLIQSSVIMIKDPLEPIMGQNNTANWPTTNMLTTALNTISNISNGLIIEFAIVNQTTSLQITNPIINNLPSEALDSFINDPTGQLRLNSTLQMNEMRTYRLISKVVDGVISYDGFIISSSSLTLTAQNIVNIQEQVLSITTQGSSDNLYLYTNRDSYINWSGLELDQTTMNSSGLPGVVLSAVDSNEYYNSLIFDNSGTLTLQSDDNTPTIKSAQDLDITSALGLTIGTQGELYLYTNNSNNTEYSGLYLNQPGEIQLATIDSDSNYNELSFDNTGTLTLVSGATIPTITSTQELNINTQSPTNLNFSTNEYEYGGQHVILTLDHENLSELGQGVMLGTRDLTTGSSSLLYFNSEGIMTLDYPEIGPRIRSAASQNLSIETQTTNDNIFIKTNADLNGSLNQVGIYLDQTGLNNPTSNPGVSMRAAYDYHDGTSNINELIFDNTGVLTLKSNGDYNPSYLLGPVITSAPTQSLNIYTQNSADKISLNTNYDSSDNYTYITMYQCINNLDNSIEFGFSNNFISYKSSGDFNLYNDSNIIFPDNSKLKSANTIIRASSIPGYEVTEANARVPLYDAQNGYTIFEINNNITDTTIIVPEYPVNGYAINYKCRSTITLYFVDIDGNSLHTSFTVNPRTIFTILYDIDTWVFDV